jgi:hypothetical protein
MHQTPYPAMIPPTRHLPNETNYQAPTQ